ncbi:porin [Variovorax sp. J22R133]|uniref:porin n=1 Tax=Variovorax brevis TaxID=3053503 RepID=UPI0025790E7B|nr:porin [Variovorax sp. J22R133]MDM0114106.1 porin [Variovorax sp. J22R133]
MSKSLLRVLFAGVGLLAASATYAQDSLQIYGIADTYVEGISGGGGSIWRLQSGGRSASRLGFKGREDLGGGLYSVFTLEMGINFDDGSTGQGSTFGRQSFVGVGDERFGAVTLGRQYTGFWHITDEFSEFSNSPDGPSSATVGGFGGYEPVRGSDDSATGHGAPARIDNAVKYETPVWGGFRFGVQGGFGEVVNNAGGNRIYDGYARYDQGPVDLALGVVDDKGGSVSPLAHRRSWIVGAAYSFGNLSFKGAFLFVDDRTPTNLDGSGWWLGADYKFGVNLVKIQYVENRPKYIDDAKTQGLGVQYEYTLSKRTLLYTGVTYFKNQENAGSGLGRASFTIPAGVTNTVDNDLTEWVGGIRFSF